MKNKIITLVSALTMAFTSVASAAVINDTGLTIVYDAVESTQTEAIVKIYLKGYASKTVEDFMIPLAVDSSIVDTTTLAAESSTRVTAQVGTTGYNSNYGYACVTHYDTKDITWAEDEPLLTVKLPLKSALTSKSELSMDEYEMYVYADGEEEHLEGYAKANILPQSASVTGTTVNSDANSDTATYYKATNVSLSGTPYWYNGAKKLKANAPNVDGTADLGLVYTGTDAPASLKVVSE